MVVFICCSGALNLPTSTHGSLPVELLSSCLASCLCQHADYSSLCTGNFLISEKFLPAHFSSLLSPCSSSLLPSLKMHLMFVLLKASQASPATTTFPRHREHILSATAITLGCSLCFDLLPQAVLHCPWLCPQHRGVGRDLSVNTEAVK